MAMIACMLITLWAGRKPTLRTIEMLRLYFAGWASKDELADHIARLKEKGRRTGRRLAVRLRVRRRSCCAPGNLSHPVESDMRSLWFARRARLRRSMPASGLVASGGPSPDTGGVRGLGMPAMSICSPGMSDPICLEDRNRNIGSYLLSLPRPNRLRFRAAGSSRRTHG